jgi:hypothetical protein
MKSLNTQHADGELWYLKSPMKIIRRCYTLADAESRLQSLIARYVSAMASGVWPMASRSYCDSIECGFREKCWD